MLLYAIAAWLFALGAAPPALAWQVRPAIALAANAETQPQQQDQRKPSPEELMNRRFPQPVRVGNLVGLPVLDFDDSTIGYVEQVVRTPEGKIQLIVPYWRWFGWVKPGGFIDRYHRRVAVPIETVVILARQLDALEMTREDFESAPTWTVEQSSPLGVDEKIRIALGRR